jgi:putative OPT family oligopeptide transporter
MNSPVYPATLPISGMSALDIYRNYVRFIGVGAIATAGIFGVLKSLRVIVGSFSIALKAFRHGEAEHTERTDRDLNILIMLAGVVVCAIAVGVFFGNLGVTWTVLAVGLGLLLLFSFFFTSVAANAIATTANNPASGMTMLTVIVSALVLLNFGLSGTTGMFFVMAIAGMVCTALCVSGQFITDLKIGYWLGSTPAAQQKVKLLGVAVAAIASGLTIILLAHTFQFGEAAPGDMRQVLAAPQASIMKALVVGFLSHQPVAYLLFGIGAMVSVVMEMLGKSSLVFALGMYLPLGLTSPILAGGLLSHLVNKKSDKTPGEEGKSIRDRGVILASGLMAGGALGGVLGAALRLFPSYREDLIQTPFFTNNAASQMVSAVLFIGLCLYVWLVSQKKEKAS